MKRRAGSTRFIGPEDAFKIAGVLFALRARSHPSEETLLQLVPDDAFAREVVSALTEKPRARKAHVSSDARKVARALKPLSARR